MPSGNDIKELPVFALQWDLVSYQLPEHLAIDLRQMAERIDGRVGFETMDGDILRKAAHCFDKLPIATTAEEARENLKSLPDHPVYQSHSIEGLKFHCPICEKDEFDFVDNVDGASPPSAADTIRCRSCGAVFPAQEVRAVNKIMVRPLEEGKTAGWKEGDRYCEPLSEGYYLKYPIASDPLPLFMVWYYSIPIGAAPVASDARLLAQDHHRRRILKAMMPVTAAQVTDSNERLQFENARLRKILGDTVRCRSCGSVVPLDDPECHCIMEHTDEVPTMHKQDLTVYAAK